MKLAWVLDDLCGRLGLCLSPAQRERLLTMKHRSAEGIAQAVFDAEGLDSTDHQELYAAALYVIARHGDLLTHDHQRISDLQPSEPWFRPEPRNGAALAAEARVEIGPDHELAAHELTSVVKCAGCDEVIFSVDDGTFAQVHLTWAQHPEPEPWPATQRLRDFLALETAIANHQH